MQARAHIAESLTLRSSAGEDQILVPTPATGLVVSDGLEGRRTASWADLSLRTRPEFGTCRLQQLCYSPVRSTKCSTTARCPPTRRAESDLPADTTRVARELPRGVSCAT
jgi:hypothetical protein